jgi:hypothetical protein
LERKTRLFLQKEKNGSMRLGKFPVASNEYDSTSIKGKRMRI